MRQQDFERKNEHLWREVEALVMKEAARVSQKNAVASGSAEGGADLVDLPDLYSQLCHQLALAKHRRYSSGLVNKLNDLCVQTHHYLYRQNRRHEFLFIEFCLHRFPAALHKNARFVWVALASFLIPALLMGVLCFINEDMIFSLLSPADVYSFESMYEPGNHAIGRERGSQTDLMMFGFYIKNNIGISFRTFAGGVLLGLGSLFFLVYNGLFLGAAAGHITSIGYQETFFPFVVGHGAF
ncbi:MAG: stage II sporulation protein M, partial [Pseudomonadales bacterium]|nr:stage II sporulation protein M [Pseudomonadales bacterium]